MVVVWGFIGFFLVMLVFVMAERVLVSVRSVERIRPGDTHPSESQRPRWLQEPIDREHPLDTKGASEPDLAARPSRDMAMNAQIVAETPLKDVIDGEPIRSSASAPWTSGRVRVKQRSRTIVRSSDGRFLPLVSKQEPEPSPEPAPARDQQFIGVGSQSLASNLPYKLVEFHYIVPIENVPSILESGILSFNRAEKLQHRSVAMAEVNQRRHYRVVENGLTVHDHANLYFNARNPMMYKRREEHATLCVLRVSTRVLEKPWLAVADGNAASDDTVISTVWKPALTTLDYQTIFAERWTSIPDGKRKRCAELLVLGEVEPEYITGAYVSCATSLGRLNKAAPGLPVTISEQMFFYSPRWVH